MKVNSRALLVALFGITLLLAGCAKSAAGEQAIPTEQSQVPRLTPKQVKDILDSGQPVVFVDTRSRGSWEALRIPGALSIPLAEIESRLKRLKALKAEVSRMLAQCAKGSVADCRIIDVLAHHEHCISSQH